MFHQRPRFPQCKYSNNSMTTGFPLNQFGLASASSCAQGNNAGSPYSMQTPDHRFSQERLNLSGDDLPYGTVHDFWNDSTSSGTSFQHSTPEHSYQQFGYYNQSGKPLTTLQCGATSNVSPGSLSLQTDPINYGLPIQNRPFHQIDPQDFSSTALDARQPLSHWDHTTIYSEDPQHGYLRQSQSDATSVQPDMRYNTSWQFPCHVLGQRSFNSTLCQPGPFPMGMGLSEVILKQPDITLGTLAEAVENDFNSIESHCPRTNKINAFAHEASMYRRPSSLQHPTKQSSMTESNKNWSASSAKAKDNDVIEDSDALEHVVGPNGMLCWNRSVPTTDGSMEECHYQHQQFLNTRKRPRGHIQGLTSSSSSPKTCTSEDVHHQVAFSQFPAASGLQPWVTAAPPSSMCVQQQCLSFFDTDAAVAFSGFPLTRSSSAGPRVGHSCGENRGIEREASVSSFLPAESWAPSGAQFVNIHSDVSHLNASVSHPDSIEWLNERRDVMNDKAFGAANVDARGDFSTAFSADLSQSMTSIRNHDGRLLYVCKFCQYVCFYLSKMKTHLRIHTGDAPYTCSHCGQAFKHSWNLKAHERIHTGLKPFTCRYCSEAFRCSGDRKNHERTHTD